VIIGNRVFNGFTQGRHPVRQAHELINVLVRGEIRGTAGTFSFWNGDKFQISDLVSYFGGAGLIDSQFAALEPVTHRVPFGRLALGFESYAMDLERMLDEVRARYPAKGADDTASTFGPAA
jgi:hypothetical protein